MSQLPLARASLIEVSWLATLRNPADSNATVDWFAGFESRRPSTIPGMSWVEVWLFPMNRMFKVPEVGEVDVGGPVVVDEAKVVVVVDR